MANIRRDGAVVVVELDPAESALLGGLVQQLSQLLEPPQPAEVQDPLAELVDLPPDQVAAPEDPVLRRLLPDAYRSGVPDAAELSAEFRRLTDGELRRTKVAALRRLASDAANGGSRLDEDQAEEWLHAIADIRLALGTRLDITEDMTAEIERAPVNSPRWETLVVYDWLSVLQETLVDAVCGQAP